MDHAVKASRSHPWNKLRFENDELEELYQRYTHKIQWISVFGVVTLVVMLTGIMAILSLAYNQAATVHVSRYFSLSFSSTHARLPNLECLQWLPLSSLHHYLDSPQVPRDSGPSSAVFMLCNFGIFISFLHHFDAEPQWLRLTG